ncbi:MAG: agmatine deiminase family protein [Planctomycetota bacterium]
MRTSTRLVLLTLLMAPVATPRAQEQPQYPEGAAVPRSLTTAEANWLRTQPLRAPDAVTPPPTGPVDCVAEYEPMSGVLIAWEGPGSWTSILANMARHITTTGNADVWVAVDTTGEQTTVRNTLSAAGANMARVRFVVRRTDTIWMRDYGPRYIYQGECRAIVDHTYNRPRPNDNAFSRNFASVRGHRLYELPLVHGGGNYHLDAVARGRTTRLINNENPSLTEAEIDTIWNDYQNLDTTFYDPLPASVDATQHIDMWMQVIADDAVIISDWPFNQGSIQDQICDGAAVSMAAEGFTVHRVPARSVGRTHYTYTNVVLCNDLVLVPSYTNTQVRQHNDEALQAWQAAAPTKTVVQINCQGIVTAAGVMHCIMMHIPAHRGGLDPTAYLINLNGGQTLTPGQRVEITWITDDDVGVDSVDVLLSTDGGATFPTAIATGIPDTGALSWTVPDVCAGDARVRIVARDGQSRTGFDDSDAGFAIINAACTAANFAYGTGTAGQLGVPTLTANAPVLGTNLDLDLQGAWPQAPALLLVGAAPAAVPFAGATLLVQLAAQVQATTSASGDFTVTIPLPTEATLTGQSLFWQVWVAGDPGAPRGFATSAGLETRLGT